jgi:hypothetical protein
MNIKVNPPLEGRKIKVQLTSYRIIKRLADNKFELRAVHGGTKIIIDQADLDYWLSKDNK